MTTESIRIQYNDCSGRADRLKTTMVEQLIKLLDDYQITLGVPIESRVKDWDSISGKLERKSLSLTNVEDLDDLIGIRLILLFRSDLEPVEKLIQSTFKVISSEDTAKRLGEAQFGYQSQHYVVQLPKSWLKVPNMADLGDFQIEIQVRTLAQHIWAAASHKLQYKHEKSVPPPIRRTINRVAALLETVDLEFDRVLEERQNYLDVGIQEAKDSEPLNVDLLASLINDVFPPMNRTDNENYAELLTNISNLNIRTVSELEPILKRHLDAAMEDDRERVQYHADSEEFDGTTKERNDKGVFKTHVGLTRWALRAEVGDEAMDWAMVTDDDWE